MTDVATAEVYSLPRGEVEKERLNAQHASLVEFVDNHLIHPSIPQDQVKRIADVGTGTGIWLLDAAKLFRSPSMIYQGFDISGLQFPAEIPQGLGQITFSEQDIVKPFPTEHLGKYDVVHVRLLVQALKEEDVETAVRNVAALLRPGGYLQWEDAEWDDITTNPPHAEAQEANEVLNEYMKAVGISGQLPALLASAMANSGLESVKSEKHWHHENEGRAKIIPFQLNAAVVATLPKTLEDKARREGTDAGEAERRAKGLTKKLVEQAQSIPWTMSFTSVVGKKEGVTCTE